MNQETKLIDRLAFGAFLLLTASLAIQKPSIIALAGNALSAADLIFPIVLSAVVISILLRKGRFVWKPVYWYFGAYLASFGFATLFAANQPQALIKTAATAYLVFVAMLAIELVDTERRLKFVVLTFLAASVVPLFVGVATIILFYLRPDSGFLPRLTSHYGAVPVGNYPRLSSTFVSASMFCNFLNVVLVLLLAARSMKWIGRRSFFCAITAVSICVLFTISSGLGAVFLTAGLWFWYCNSKSVLGCSALAASVAICLLYFATGFVALQKHATAPYSFHIPIVGIEAYPSPRLLIWTEAANNFFNNFWVGSGPGSRSAAVLFQNTSGSFSLLTDAHNSFLSVATQTGVLGLLTLSALVGYLLITGFRRLRESILIFGFTAAFLTAFVIQGSMGSFEDARHIWFLIGLLAASLRLEQENLPGKLGGGA